MNLLSRRSLASPFKPLSPQRSLSHKCSVIRPFSTTFRPPTSGQLQFPTSKTSASFRQSPLAFTFPLQHQIRLATSQVSNQPPSKDFQDLKHNAKHEAKQVTDSVADGIMGASEVSSQVKTGGVGETLHSMEELVDRVPREAWFWGGAGILPYIATAATSVWLARSAGLAELSGNTQDLEAALALLYHVEAIQISYGAVMLSFLGAVHWGMEFANLGGKQGMPRYLLGIAPVLAAWPTLLLPSHIALATQWAAFTGIWAADIKATGLGWTPRWYATYRFWLTLAVGCSIIATLGGTNYFGPGSTTIASTGHKLKELNEKEQKEIDKSEKNKGIGGRQRIGKVEGSIEAVEGDDSWVEIKNIPKIKEREEKERKKKEEEAQKKREEDSKSKV